MQQQSIENLHGNLNITQPESEISAEPGNDQTGKGQNNQSEGTQQPQLRQSTRIRWPPERYSSIVSFPDSDPFLD